MGWWLGGVEPASGLLGIALMVSDPLRLRFPGCKTRAVDWALGGPCPVSFP